MEKEIERLYDMATREGFSMSRVVQYNNGEEILNLYTEGSIGIRVTEKPEVDGNPVNNLSITTPAICINGDVSVFEGANNLTEDTDFDVYIEDSQGLWVRLRTSNDYNLENNEIETLKNITNEAEVWLSFEHHSVSTKHSQSEIGGIAREGQELYEKMLEHDNVTKRDDYNNTNK